MGIEHTQRIEQVADTTYQLSLTIPGTDWPFVVYFITESPAVLIEPCAPAAAPSIKSAMDRLGIKDLAYIIPTHIHIDHAGAMGALARLFPAAKVVLHPQAVKHAIDPSYLIQSTKISFGEDVEKRYGAFLPVPRSQVMTVADGETLRVNDRELQIVYAPGHAGHHIAVFDRKTGGLFCGEALGLPLSGKRSAVLPAIAAPAFNPDEYLQTMEKLRKLSPKLLFYSHFGAGKGADELITDAARNTAIFGQIVRDALRRGETRESIDGRLRDHVRSVIGVDFDDADRATLDRVSEAFIFYFKRNGQV